MDLFKESQLSQISNALPIIFFLEQTPIDGCHHSYLACHPSQNNVPEERLNRNFRFLHQMELITHRFYV